MGSLRAAGCDRLIHTKTVQQTQAVGEDANGAAESGWLRPELVDDGVDSILLVQMQCRSQSRWAGADDDGLGTTSAVAALRVGEINLPFGWLAYFG